MVILRKLNMLVGQILASAAHVKTYDLGSFTLCFVKAVCMYSILKGG